jgi:hypothetical protein
MRIHGTRRVAPDHDTRSAASLTPCVAPTPETKGERKGGRKKNGVEGAALAPFSSLFFSFYLSSGGNEPVLEMLNVYSFQLSLYHYKKCSSAPVSGTLSKKWRQVGSCGSGPLVRNSRATLGRPNLNGDSSDLGAAAFLRPSPNPSLSLMNRPWRCG